MKVDALRTGAQRAAFAAVGAPVVVGRHLADYGGKMGSSLKHELEAFAAEGERLAGRLRDHNPVDGLKDRVDIDHLQVRVERLRDQLEEVLTQWRESFRPEETANLQPVPDATGTNGEEDAEADI
jgi:hypothetical protein